MRLNTAAKPSGAVHPPSWARTLLPPVAWAVLAVWLAAVPGWAAPAGAAPQLIKLPQKLKLDKVVKRAEQLRDLQVTQDEELQLGTEVSARVRDRYGVVQDEAVHRYVTLVGTLLVKKSPRPGLPFRFIVLDTDGVNAFAAPGGFIHITRGALGLMSSESELAGVLAHEISHVTEKHTIRAIQKNKVIQITADESITKNPAIWHKLVDATSDLVMAGFGRGEELESDREGLAIADAAGYAPRGLGEFLRRLEARNQSSTGKQGLFASHPEMSERLETIDREIRARKYASAAVLSGRFKAAIPFTAKPVAEIATVEAGTSGLAGGGGTTKPADSPKKSGFSLSKLVKPAGTEKKSAEVTGSGASRGVDTERNARGGAEKSMVTVRVTAAELEAFRKEGNLKP
jgi:beta-barrel assembly-enhancing protease